MTTLHEQLTLAIKNTSLNITPNTDWTVEEYHEFMAYVHAGWLWQDCGKWFKIHPDWDKPPMWTPDLEEDDDFYKEDDCCKTCEQTDIEICYDCGECADPSLPNRCCECEEEEPYCFKDTTIDTVEKDICFCSVGGCVKPTEFDYRFE